MTDLVLPEDLSSLDLDELNRQVRAGEVTLDWSEVREAPREALRRLLAGCDLVQDGDALGIGSLPDHLSGAVIDAVFNTPSGEQEEGFAGEEPRKEGDGHRRPMREAEEQVLRPPSPVEVRQELQDLVLKDLLGPAGGPEEEVEEDRLRDRYVLGLLAPGGEPMSKDADDDLAVEGDQDAEEGAPEPDALGPETMFPSSLGLSFIAASETEALRLTASWGRYERTYSEHATTDSGGPARVWKRTPVEGVCERLSLTEPIEWRPCPDQEVVVRGTARRCPEGWITTLFLVNEQRAPRQSKDAAWLYQPELTVEDADGNAVFLPRSVRREPFALDTATVEEEQSMEMLYRGYRQFAVGHGVSVHSAFSPGRTDRAVRLCTCVAPQYDVPATEMPTAEEVPELAELVLDMKELAEMGTPELVANLERLAAAYAGWIARQWARVDDPAEGLNPYRAAADAALSACEDAQARMVEGIAVLRQDERALQAFRFMNRAMWLQRVHTVLAQEARAHGKVAVETVDVPEQRSWRLFQLAFILLNLPGLTDLHHQDRSDSLEAVADLLWFPTGGGKTEAYLGLTAYTLAIRRLQETVAGRDGEYGVAVLMRYTLRLLTLQQFQRAAALICACEMIRKDAWFDGDTRWGRAPFRLGLWVGNRATPNRTEQSAEAVRQAHGQRPRPGAPAAGSPAQLTHCPWCGCRIDPGRDIRVEPGSRGRGRTFMFCGDTRGECPFSQRQSPEEGLPLLVVDEEIYRLLPALLISTVDKFAQMPWRGEAQMLFGQVDARCERHGFHSPDMEPEREHAAWGELPRSRVLPCGPLRPPDLIIQDELHLISGPLGSMVGIYETAVDRLASWEVDGQVVRPKVIASTATVRRAGEQMRGLFVRSVNVFPPHGVDIEDNFFSRRREPDDATPGRRYLGMYAPGRRLKAVLIRVYVAHLAAAQTLFERYGAAADPWMTLVGYFNSMRELGGMRRLVDDDVRSRLRRTEEHGLANRRAIHVEELTSRKSSADIPTVLERLERPFEPGGDADGDGRRKGRAPSPFSPIDVLLATNMLSVGMDVQRLGLMVVAGQPKTTAEYIQATSRVGRSKDGPGLVCAVYNWTRPRDLSHYESFEHYHATFYQQVEALSVTPFAPRARDRALSGVLVSLVRLGGPDFNDNLAAGRISADHPLVREALDAVVRRAVRVSDRPETAGALRAELNERLKAWLRDAGKTEGGRRLGYKSSPDGLTVGLLQSPDMESWGDFTCLQSLRDVEPEIALILRDGGLDDEPAPLRMRMPVARVEGDEEAEQEVEA